MKAAGSSEVYKHIIRINADTFTVTDSDSIPTGEFRRVDATPYDFRVPVELGPAMARLPDQGFDDNFCVTLDSAKSISLIAE